jgi:hypothetical protein
MLRIDLHIVEACPAGTNLAETTFTERPEQVSSGKIVMRRDYESVYIKGLPLGDDSGPVLAPIDLKVKDIVYVSADKDDRVPLEVVRNGKTIWVNDLRKAAEDARIADKREALELRRKLAQ